MPGEPERVLGKVQVHPVIIGARGLDPGDDHAQGVALEGLHHRLAEGHLFVDRGDVLDAGAPGHLGQVGHARGRMRFEAPGGQKAPVVEYDVDQVRGTIAGQRGEGAQIHQDRAVAVQDHDLLLGPVKRQTQADGRRQAHGVLQVEEVLPVAQVVELLGAGPHDGHDGLVLELRVDHLDAASSLHLRVFLHEIPGQEERHRRE